jgi:hypothetical protein
MLTCQLQLTTYEHACMHGNSKWPHVSANFNANGRLVSQQPAICWQLGSMMSIHFAHNCVGPLLGLNRVREVRILS